MNTTQLERGIAIRKQLAQQNEIRMAVEASSLRTASTYLAVQGHGKGDGVYIDFEKYPYLLPLFEQLGADLVRTIEEHTTQLEAEFAAL